MITIEQEISAFLFDRGGLHDCKVGNLSWDLESNRIQLSVFDMNANYVGLPEYLGPQPGRIVFDGIQSVSMEAVPPKNYLRIYEASLREEEDGKAFELRLSPAGKFVVHCQSMSIELMQNESSGQPDHNNPISVPDPRPA